GRVHASTPRRDLPRSTRGGNWRPLLEGLVACFLRGRSFRRSGRQVLLFVQVQTTVSPAWTLKVAVAPETVERSSKGPASRSSSAARWSWSSPRLLAAPAAGRGPMCRAVLDPRRPAQP